MELPAVRRTQPITKAIISSTTHVQMEHWIHDEGQLEIVWWKIGVMSIDPTARMAEICQVLSVAISEFWLKKPVTRINLT